MMNNFFRFRHPEGRIGARHPLHTGKADRLTVEETGAALQADIAKPYGLRERIRARSVRRQDAQDQGVELGPVKVPVGDIGKGALVQDGDFTAGKGALLERRIGKRGDGVFRAAKELPGEGAAFGCPVQVGVKAEDGISAVAAMTKLCNERVRGDLGKANPDRTGRKIGWL